MQGRSTEEGKVRHIIYIFQILIMMVAVACGGEAGLTPTPEPEVEGEILALSTYSASLGTLVEVYGSGFPEPGQGTLELEFRGVFRRADGIEESVSFQDRARYVDPATARWTGYGPFLNPFSPSGQLGHFLGEVSGRVQRPDGTRTESSPPLAIDFEVLPSLMVRDFQPLSASCSGPVQRALGGAAYRLQVEALGFEPVLYTYTLSTPSVAGGRVALRQLASGTLDTVGQRGDLVMPQVPAGLPSYGAVVSVEGRSSTGEVYRGAFGIQVHRPLEVFYNGNVTVAEVFAPTPVSGCIPGGEAGRDVDYNESQSETRSRGYDLNWNQSWLSSRTVSTGTSQTVGLSEQNGVGFSTTNGESFNWSLGAEVNGSVSLMKLVELGVGFRAGIGGDRSQSVTQSTNRTSGIDVSSTTTDSDSITEGNSGGVGGGFSWQTSSSETIGRGFGGMVLPRTYGVFYRQAMRLLRRAAVVTYNQCGAGSVVAELDFYDWTWSPDLALASECPPLPQSNLPKASCYVPPCGGE